MKSKIVTLALRSMRSIGFCCAYGFFRSRLIKQQVAIIAYHRISKVTDYPWSLTPVTPRDFERELRYLSSMYRVISLEELSASLNDLKALPQKTAVITFDDGYKDIYLNAYPIIKKYQTPATVFLTTGHIGTGHLFWWDKVSYVIWKTEFDTINLGEFGTYHLNSANSRLRVVNTILNRLKQLPITQRDELVNRTVISSGVDIPSSLGEELILSWNEIKEMNRNGINFGAHTVTHPILTRLPLDEAAREIISSKKHIEEELGREVTTFCYPNGKPDDFNSDIEEIIKNSGFKCAVTAATPAAFVSSTAQRYKLPRIPGTSSYDKFEFVMSGLYTDLATIKDVLSR
jgi:peptidoglycan/xylan/chitin deacetylase (PgdA/CDA1 family)